MNVKTIPWRAQSKPLCQLCEYITKQQRHSRCFYAASTAFKAPNVRRPTARLHGIPRKVPIRNVRMRREVKEVEAEGEPLMIESNGDQLASLQQQMQKVQGHIQWIETSPKVEDEAAVLKALQGLHEISRKAIAIRTRRPIPAKIEVRQSSAGAILSIGTEDTKGENVEVRKSPSQNSSVNELPSPTYISELATNLLKHPNVFISPRILAVYVQLQRLLKCVRAIPEILYLYANKPVPQLGSSPPKFSQPSPNAAKQAIPHDAATEALTAAIDAKDLILALDIIKYTYAAPAWRRRRILTKFGLPGVLAALAPLAVYTIAQEASIYSNFIDPRIFKINVFLGVSTYLLCTSTLGYIALTTHNDHFERVVWRPGIPLTHRYLREDERAALDRVACAWGFKEAWRRGDEEGEDWEGLRTWIMLRGMILDKPDLMPGMNPKGGGE